MNKRRLFIAVASISILVPNAVASPKNVTVFAASSLTDSYTQLGKQFEKDHAGIKIIFSFLASSTLANQIKSGAPADIFVSASPADMKIVTTGSNYLVNHVVLGIPKNSNINKILDLNSKVIWIQCAHEVPCGAAADSALAGEGVTSKPVSTTYQIAQVKSNHWASTFMDYLKSRKVIKYLQSKGFDLP